MAVASRLSSSPMAASTQDESPPAARRRSASGSFHGRVKPLSCHSRIAASYRRSGSGSIITAEAYSSCPSSACTALPAGPECLPSKPAADLLLGLCWPQVAFGLVGGGRDGGVGQEPEHVGFAVLEALQQVQDGRL